MWVVAFCALLFAPHIHAAPPKIDVQKDHATVVTTTTDDQSTVIERRTCQGQFINRQWLGLSGKTVLEEHLVSTDAYGSAHMTQQAGQKKRAISWQFGPDHHLKTIQGALHASTFFDYDEEGRCILKRTGGGREIHYVWDTHNRLKRLYSFDQSVDYNLSYDAEDRICSITDSITNHTVSRTFDDQGRLLSDGEEGYALRIEYTNDGSIYALFLPDSSSLLYESDLVHHSGNGPTWSLPLVSQDPPEALSSPHELRHTDPLGSWEELCSFDEMNQLQTESGEFNLIHDFDPFGLSRTATNGTYDDDGNLIAFEEGGTSWTYQYDALGRLIGASSAAGEERYRYDGFGRIQEIVSNNQHKHLLWFDDLDLGSTVDHSIIELKIFSPLTSRPIGVELNGTVFTTDQDRRGSVTALIDPSTGRPREVYRYSAFGHLHAYDPCTKELLAAPSSPWLYSGKRWLSSAAAYDFGTRRYFPSTLRWAERDPLGLVDTPDDRIYARNNPIEYADPNGLFPQAIAWSSLSTSLVKALKTIMANTYKSISFAKERLDWILEFRSTYEDLFFQLMGRTWLRLIGYNLDSSCQTTYGNEELSSKVRITLINGILNGTPEVEESATLLSSTHGGVPIHCVYSATSGFSGDLLRGVFAKIGLPSRQAKLLASLWKRLIEEMGGPNKGGMILHYAHSLGATDTLNALRRLTPEERSCIRIATFGSPTLIDEGACSQVDNYVSEKDGVPILDFLRYGDSPHIHFIPSDALPLVDHMFNGKTYKNVLEILGQRFQEEFLRSQTVAEAA